LNGSRGGRLDRRAGCRLRRAGVTGRGRLPEFRISDEKEDYCRKQVQRRWHDARHDEHHDQQDENGRPIPAHHHPPLSEPLSEPESQLPLSEPLSQPPLSEPLSLEPQSQPPLSEPLSLDPQLSPPESLLEEPLSLDQEELLPLYEPEPSDPLPSTCIMLLKAKIQSEAMLRMNQGSAAARFRLVFTLTFLCLIPEYENVHPLYQLIPGRIARSHG
jgi:hypothetical protein